MDELTRKFEVIDAEWTEWFDRFRRLHARIARRQARDELRPDTEVREDAPTTVGENGGAAPIVLSSVAAAAQARILARRNRVPQKKEDV